ncbi:hypothetical protein ACFL0T_01735 [Candidatus Omnitrophota bacterium]
MRTTVKKLMICAAALIAISLNAASAAAQGSGETTINQIVSAASGSADLQVRIYNYTTDTYDSTITWSNVDLSVSRGWILADQCLEITHTSPNPKWGIQVYTDNEHNTLPIQSYTGAGDPAGLIGQTTTGQALSTAWLAFSNWNPGNPIPEAPLLTPDGLGFSGGAWHFLKDKNTPDNPDTPDDDESFQDGAEYVTVWNQKGVATSDTMRTGNPPKVYLFISANFAQATKQKYKSSSFTFEHFTDATLDLFPFYLYKDGAPAIQLSYEFLSAQMDKYFGGEKKRLLESYSQPYPPRAADPNDNLWSVAFTYDNALAITAYLARPTDDNLARAKILCKTLIWLQGNDPKADGRWRDAYNATLPFSGTTVPLSDAFFQTSCTGNVAWTICAMAQYYKNSGDTDLVFMNQILDSIKEAGEFVHSNFFDSGQSGYFFGFDVADTLQSSKSTEHNIAAYVAFAHLYDITQESKWLTRANDAKSFVENVAWDASAKRYIIGLTPAGNPDVNIIAADANLLSTLAIANQARIDDAVEYTVENLYFEDASTRLEGIDYGYHTSQSPASPDGIWFEGTAQLAAAYKVLGFRGFVDKSDEVLDCIKRAQHWAANTNFSGIVAASKTFAQGGLTTGLGWKYFASPHVGATAWYAGAYLNYNMLWGTSLEEEVPVPGQGRSFTQDPNLLIDSNEYLNNHYYTSGFDNYRPGVLTVDRRYKNNPYSGDTCIKIAWSGEGGGDGWRWAGLYWQEPENEWSGGPGKGYDIRDAKILAFRIRTDAFSLVGSGTVRVRCCMGYANDSSGRNPPDIPPNYPLQWRTLTTDWQLFVVPLLGADMSHVSNGLTLIVNDEDENVSRPDKKMNIYIDDIIYNTY